MRMMSAAEFGLNAWPDDQQVGRSGYDSDWRKIFGDVEGAVTAQR